MSIRAFSARRGFIERPYFYTQGTAVGIHLVSLFSHLLAASQAVLQRKKNVLDRPRLKDAMTRLSILLLPY
jgi:hypothetical protein